MTSGEEAGSQPPQHSNELIIRIDERTKAMSSTMDSIKEEINQVKTRVGAVEKTVSELGPIKTIVFGGVGLVLTAVILALLAYVIYNPSIKETIREVPAANR